MAIRYKTAQQVEKMRLAGRIVRKVLDELGAMAAPGVTTKELDAAAERMTLELGAECLFKGVPGRGSAGPYPGAICTSINEQLVHGIPSDRAIRDGDVLSIDFGVRLDGWCADAAETYVIGQAPPDMRRLVEVTRATRDMAVELCSPGEKWSRIARQMQAYVEREGFSVVRELVGHGIGTEMWEDPKVPNFVSRELLDNDIVLKEGLVIAIEPMVNMGQAAVAYARDGWTVLTKDGRPSAHFEHTVAITAAGVDVLTDGR